MRQGVGELGGGDVGGRVENCESAKPETNKLRSASLRSAIGRLSYQIGRALYHSRLRIPALPVALLIGFGLLLVAQTPVPPIDNDQARVVIAHDQPHKKCTLHEHKLDRVMIYMDAGGRQEFHCRRAAKPTRWSSRLPRGDVRWSPANGMHTSEIVSDKPVTIVEVEVKKEGDPSKTVNTPLDPLKVDPKDYKLEFENSKVRVVRVKMAAGRKVPLHEHQLNRVVVYLTDQNGSV